MGEELVKKRDIKMDSFLWDDGWDDAEEGMWEFDRERFPTKFAPLNKAAHKYNISNGIWLSPWGGYGQAKDKRVEEAKSQGYETNKNGLSLAGPKYAKRFKEAALQIQDDANINLFKFDGVAGVPAEVGAETEAMLDTSGELRKLSTKKKRKVWINLTTGTWPSPFFMLWVDSIWRGHRDVMAFGPRQLPETTTRQRWQAFRECIVYELIYQRGSLFPLARLMVHGVVLSQHGDARDLGLHEANTLDWAQEVWSFAAMGLQLQELYISVDLMTTERWDELAAGLRWSTEHHETLADTHWITKLPFGCAKESYKPYAWATWRGRSGFLTLRNPRGDVRVWSESFSLAEALELPHLTLARLDKGRDVLVIKVEKRLAPGSPPNSRCAFIEGAVEHGSTGCTLSAQAQTRVKLHGAELLVLKVMLEALDVGKDEL